MASYTSGTSMTLPKDNKKAWLLVDAKDMVLGRLATRIAMLLRGKNKAHYVPYLDSGSNIVVVNAAKIKVTGQKLEKESFFWHTGYPGGIKEEKWGDTLKGKHPEDLLKRAVRRMMPKDSPLARKQMKSLYIYMGDEHMHVAQQPESVKI